MNRRRKTKGKLVKLYPPKQLDASSCISQICQLWLVILICLNNIGYMYGLYVSMVDKSLLCFPYDAIDGR